MEWGDRPPTPRASSVPLPLTSTAFAETETAPPVTSSIHVAGLTPGFILGQPAGGRGGGDRRRPSSGDSRPGSPSHTCVNTAPHTWDCLQVRDQVGTLNAQWAEEGGLPSPLEEQKVVKRLTGGGG